MQALALKSLFIVLLSALAMLARAEAPNIHNRAALGDLETGKGVFLVDIGNPKKLNGYLSIIRGTHKGMRDAGVKPDFVLVYIGPSVKYLTEEPAPDIEQVHGATVMDIALNVEKIDELGIRQEVCAVATQAFGIDNATLLPELDLVGDGFISLIGYQAQGYHLVPVF